MTQPPGGYPPGPPPPGPQGQGAAAEVPTCPRHPDRVSYVRCQRCGRPACPECQRPAAVGVQCVECVAADRRAARPTVTALGGRASRREQPVVTISIIVICVLVWIGELLSDRVFSEVALAPAVAEQEPWRLLTSAFAHSPSAPFHIMFNMLALWFIGQRLEATLGRGRFLGLYLASAIAGSVTWLVLQPVNSWSPVVGASGAVFGLFGALFVVERHLGRDVSGIFGILAINAVIGFLVPNIAWEAHLGGLVAGAAVAAALVQAAQRRSALIAWGAIVAVIALSLVAMVVKYAVGTPVLYG